MRNISLEVPGDRSYNYIMIIELSEEEAQVVIASLNEELIGNCELEPEEASAIRVVLKKMSA